VVQAYILIQAEPAKVTAVASAIGGLTGVLSAESVTGAYDVIARAEGESMSDLEKVLGQAQKVAGVTRTVSCIVVHLS
jgi:DNA-binding Lrp family transcriptional regulator